MKSGCGLLSGSSGRRFVDGVKGRVGWPVWRLGKRGQSESYDPSLFRKHRCKLATRSSSRLMRLTSLHMRRP